MKRIWLALVALTLASGVTGCGKIREMIAGRAAEKAVETSTGGDVKISTGQGSLTGSASMPAGWPSSVPQYPGSKVTTSMSTPQGKTAILETTDAIGSVASFYKSALSGMKLQADVDMGTSKVLTFNKGPQQNVSVTISQSGGKTMVTISVAGF
jgi:hypothetical protein